MLDQRKTLLFILQKKLDCTNKNLFINQIFLRMRLILKMILDNSYSIYFCFLRGIVNPFCNEIRFFVRRFASKWRIALTTVWLVATCAGKYLQISPPL